MGLLDAGAGVIGSLLGKGPVSAPDLTALFQTIDNAGENQRSLINALPAELQQQYAAYKSSNATAGTDLQTGTAALGNALKTETAANYDPNAPAVRASEDAAKTAIYAQLPGQQAAIRQALAASGGFDRGTASKQLAAPVLQAGQQFSQQVANISAGQLKQKQDATQSAINTVNTMNDQVLTQLFGMSKDQALQILNGNRQDLKDQLSSLINQSNNQTNQKLGVEGADITNKYNQSVAQNAKDNSDINAWVNLGANAIGAAPGFLSGLNSGSTTGSYNPNAPVYENQLPG